MREAVDRSDPVILGLEGTRRIFTGEYDEAVTLLREAVSRRQKDETRANSLNNLAWALLLARPDGWLDEADRASAEAIALRPKTEAMSSTRGCVLVHRGDHAQARPLLMTALKAETAPQDGQILQSHLLQAELGLGNLYGAREALLAMMDSGAVEEEVASHRALLRTAEVEHALANLVGADGIIQWPDAGAGEPLGRHLKEMRTALVAFLEEAEDDHRRESVRLALGV